MADMQKQIHGIWFNSKVNVRSSMDYIWYTSFLNDLMVEEPSIVSAKDAYIGERATLSSLRSSREVDR